MGKKSPCRGSTSEALPCLLVLREVCRWDVGLGGEQDQGYMDKALCGGAPSPNPLHVEGDAEAICSSDI